MNDMAGNGPIRGRDAFRAFVCDQASLDVLCPIVVDLGWAAAKCGKGDLRGAVQSLSIGSSPNLLMVDLSDSGDPPADIQALADVCEPGTVVIAIGQVNDVRLYRALLASGIHDYLLKPLAPDQLRETLVQAQAGFSAPRPPDAAAGPPHGTVAVIGTRGGCGASTVAASLAWLCATERKLTTALLDLDIHFGTGALMLDLEPGRGLTDAIENPARIDGLFIERAMIRANDRLAILSAEAAMNAPLTTDDAAFLHLQEELRGAFEMTVIDLPRHMLVNFPPLLGHVTAVVLVTELTLAGARDTIRILSWLKGHVVAAPVVVANKVHPGQSEIGRAEFEATIERRIDFVLPGEPRSATQAARLGQTFAEANRTSAAGVGLRQLAGHVHAIARPGGEVIARAAKKTSRLGKIDIKAMLAKKGKGAAAA